MKTRLYAAASVTALAFVAGWLVCGAWSPLRDYFAAHETFPEWWALANAAPALVADSVALTLRGRAGWPIYYALFAAQWFAFGYWLPSLAAALRRWLWKPLA